MKAKIINTTDFGGLYSIDFLTINNNTFINDELVSNWVLTEILPTSNLIKPLWNGVEWIEGETIEEYNFRITPKTLTRMKFIMQVYITTNIKYDDIIYFVNNLPSEMLNDLTKYIILTRLNDCTYFERYSENLILIATMMGITDEQLNEIFINGNLLD